MIRELLQRWATLTDPQLHLVYLGLQAAVAVLLLVATAVAVLRRGGGGWGTRLAACAVILLASAALVVGFDGVPLDAVGTRSLGIPFRWFVGSTAATAVTVALTSASARTGLLVAAAHSLASLGLLIYLVLLTAVPNGVDPTWEIQRFADFVTFVAAGTVLVLAAGFLSARSHGWPTRALYAVAALVAVVAVAVGLGAHPRPGLATWFLAGAPLAGAGLWVAWVAGLRGRFAGALPITRHTARRLAVAAVIAAPLAMAALAVVLGGGGSAREASRVSVLGLELTPGLIVPFLFAPALGLLLAGPHARRSVLAALGLTVALAGLLMAQKEVGNTAVVLGVAAVAFLVVRGTLPHLLAGAGLAAAGVALAYHLAPVIHAIPFTFRERLHLWLGGADLVRRGGHLVAASHVTYDVGGFWGIGIHSTPGLNLPRTVVALDTDFPLAIVGLYGGMILLAAYVALFVCFGLLLLDTVRRLGFGGDTRRARRDAAILSGLAAVPITSTSINLAGAITHLLPFTGVPVVFASYGAIFTLGTLLIVAVFVLASNRDAARSLVKTRAERALRDRAAGASVPLAPPAVPAESVAPEVADRSPAVGGAEGPADARRGRWPTLDVARMRSLTRTLRRAMRFRTVRGGLAVLMLGLPALGVAFGERLYERYTDTARLYGHPRVTDELRIEPTDEGSTRWAVTAGPSETRLGPLAESQRLRLGSLVLRYRQGRLQVRGACFPVARWTRGVTFGFAGMLDAPPLPILDQLVAPVLERMPVPARDNDVVIPFGDIAMRHAEVRRTGPDTFAVRALSPFGTTFAADAAGHTWSPWVADDVRLGQGFTLGVADPLRFVLDEDPNAPDVCAELTEGALFEYALSPLGPTILGGTALLRRNMGRATVDFELAEAIKEAGEDGLLAARPRRGLVVAPWTGEDRARWSERRAHLFRQLFQIVRIRLADGTERDGLAWSRPFYRDGSRGLQPRKELEAFVIDGTRVLGLADSFRFAQVLPRGHARLDPERVGALYDRKGAPLSRLDVARRRMVPLVAGTGPLIGVSWEGRAIRDGLLRVFAPLLRGPEPLPDPRAELEDLLAGEWRGAWGWDVTLTLDADIQRRTHEVIAAEVAALDAREPGVVHHAQAIVLGPRNEILAVAQQPDAGLPGDLSAFEALREQQRASPLDAPALDAMHRRTTMGSTVKLLMAIAAFRSKEGAIFLDKGQWWIDARGDGSYGVRGRYADRGGVLASWKGHPLVPLSNYGHKSFGRVVSMHDMLVHSVNTAAAYLGLNVGLDRFLETLDAAGLRQPMDLVPPQLRDPHGLGYLLDRSAKDAATLLPAAVAVIPSDERWTLSYTARLALSGMSDYSVASLAAGSSVIARDGLYWPPTIVRSIRSRKSGEVTRFDAPAPTRVIAPEDAETLTGYMRDVVRRGTASSLRWRWGLSKEIWLEMAGKTGTGETVKPVKRGVVYDRRNKPKTRDNKAFVGIWPTSSPQPYVVTVVFEEVSHLDTRVAIRATQRIVEGIAESEGGPKGQGGPSSASNGDVPVVAAAAPGGARP